MKKIGIFIALSVSFLAASAQAADSVPGAFSGQLQWRLGFEALGGTVLHTKPYLDGENPFGKSINGVFGGTLRADFDFNPNSRWGKLYEGVYQGIGLDMHSFSDCGLLGTPVSVYVYQGAPFLRLCGNRLSLGYEWNFGAAFGWKHDDEVVNMGNSVVSTSVTAHMSLGLKLRYGLSERFMLSVGGEFTHFSNGNTSWPNGGVNTVTASLGVAYIMNADRSESRHVYGDGFSDADRPSWFYDIVAFGAWRKRAVYIDGMPELCPGKFAVAGVQVAPMRSFNRWFAAGVAIDMQWDEGAGIEPYWVDGTHSDLMRFYRPPFGKQVSIGLSAHAELTMPIFTVNIGVGYDIVNPDGNKPFYQSLTLKTFVTKHLFANVGYRLSRFRDPQNLMLGLGVRL